MCCELVEVVCMTVCVYACVSELCRELFPGTSTATWNYSSPPCCQPGPATSAVSASPTPSPSPFPSLPHSLSLTPSLPLSCVCVCIIDDPPALVWLFETELYNYIFHCCSVAGINKVARKLEVDYAPAMMGWDFHSGYCHPM